MYCPNCGKEIKENDNFCRYCGKDLRITEQNNLEDKLQQSHEDSQEKPQTVCEQADKEEYVLYDIKKHWISYVVPAFLIPLFIFYFWTIFLNSHSLFSWIIVLAILGFIIYPIARYKSDKIIITNKFAHAKIGVINAQEIDIPISKLSMFEITQTSMGRMLGYGMLSLISDGERYDYGYIDAPEDVQYIIDDPARFINESL